tara:strand:+ start:28 stop:186 length:159 start_codon:yes stop_codon:yes gene_type:complete
MEKLKFKWIKLIYWLDLNLGFWMVNERKFPSFVKQMEARKAKIHEMEKNKKL